LSQVSRLEVGGFFPLLSKQNRVAESSIDYSQLPFKILHIRFPKKTGSLNLLVLLPAYDFDEKNGLIDQAEIELLDDDRFDRAVVGSVFYGRLEVRRDLGLDHFCNVVAHFEDVRNAVSAKSAACACIVIDSYFHDDSP
jgi:hypothetical protein